jgi:TPR repeat protein
MQSLAYANTSMSDLFNKYSKLDKATDTTSLDNITIPEKKEWQQFEEIKKLYKQKKYKEIIDVIKDSANDNFAEAQLLLGHSYHFGNGVDVDNTKAIFWYKKSANQGNVNAQINLASFYFKNPDSRNKAIYWYLKAAYKGSAMAQNNLALARYKSAELNRGEHPIYLSKEDKSYIKKWLQKAMQSDNKEQENLAKERWNKWFLF